MAVFDRNRPRIHIPMTLGEWAMQAVSGACLLANIVVTLTAYPNLPARVPTHLDIAGNIDAWGGKTSVFILPAVALGLFVLVTLIERFPHVMNYPVVVTHKNAEPLYRTGRLLMTWLKAVILGMLLYMNWIMIAIAGQKLKNPGMVYLPIFIVLLLGGGAYFIFWMFGADRESRWK